MLTRSIQFLVFFALFPILLLAQSWAEKTLSELTLDQKIGQLFMPPACPLREEDHRRDWAVLIEKHHIGNAILKHSDPLTQIKFLNDLQSGSNILLIAADAEWGLAMRMKQTNSFPQEPDAWSDGRFGFDLSSRRGDRPPSETGRESSQPRARCRCQYQSRQPSHRNAGVRRRSNSSGSMRRSHGPGDAIGRNFNLRETFSGTWRYECSILTSALPLVPHARDRLETVEFVPFRRAIQEGVDAIMSAHLLVPAIDSNGPRPCLLRASPAF